MLSHGDELGRTQHGNNNVYCQDHELAWIDWDEARDYDSLTRFTGKLARLRAAHPLFRRRRFVTGRPVGDSGVADIAWLRRDGGLMGEDDWNGGEASTIAVFLSGHCIFERDALGEAIIDDSFLLLLNPLGTDVEFVLPDEAYRHSWELLVDTADPLLATLRAATGNRPGGRVPVSAHSLQVLRCAY